jgi:glycopeptidolipid biosynthesis protein
VSVNAFDEGNGSFFVLVSDVARHTPPDWEAVYGEADRAACLDYIEQNWTDIRPKSQRKRPVESRSSDM